MSERNLFENIPKPPKAVTVCTQVIMCIMPITHVVIGAMYVDDCPKQPYIPAYLIVVGVLSLLPTVLSLLSISNGSGTCCKALMCLFSFFAFCWFIAGNVLIYSIYKPNYVKNATDVAQYCNKTLYLFAFWITNLVYILLGMSLVGSCCTFICSLLARQ